MSRSGSPSFISIKHKLKQTPLSFMPPQLKNHRRLPIVFIVKIKVFRGAIKRPPPPALGLLHPPPHPQAQEGGIWKMLSLPARTAFSSACPLPFMLQGFKHSSLPPAPALGIFLPCHTIWPSVREQPFLLATVPLGKCLPVSSPRAGRPSGIT